MASSPHSARPYLSPPVRPASSSQPILAILDRIHQTLAAGRGAIKDMSDLPLGDVTGVIHLFEKAWDEVLAHLIHLTRLVIRDWADLHVGQRVRTDHDLT